MPRSSVQSTRKHGHQYGQGRLPQTVTFSASNDSKEESQKGEWRKQQVSRVTTGSWQAEHTELERPQQGTRLHRFCTSACDEQKRDRKTELRRDSGRCNRSDKGDETLHSGARPGRHRSTPTRRTGVRAAKAAAGEYEAKEGEDDSQPWRQLYAVRSVRSRAKEGDE